MTDRPNVRRAARSFRDLVVWQEANALAKVALRIADALPAGYGFLADQLRRSATSVPLNIAEGNAKPTRRDYLKSLAIARGELNEVEATTELLRGTTLAADEDVDAMRRHLAHTGRLLAALIDSLKSSQPDPPPSRHDRPSVNAPAVKVPAVNGPALEGPADEGPAVEGPAA